MQEQSNETEWIDWKKQRPSALGNKAESILMEFMGREARDKARSLVESESLSRLARRDQDELGRLGSLTRLEARRVHAAFALGRQVELERAKPNPNLRRAKDVYQHLEPRLRGLQREVFVVLLLDVQNRLQGEALVSVGTLTSSLVHPREVFRQAIAQGAAAVIVAHNHPSGDPDPSQADREVTRRLIRAGQLLGIPLLDHVVVGEGRFASLRSSMDFDVPTTVAAESMGGV
ncbi:MAG: DNA repair protein RadC [Planctomycetes bacterium]|nr:DNA repair protein RadC [Planctomycetota bacterium]